jgi:aspartyl-tRNA(Asn)/glutamyl-tRNA(Gln) amidotransferase subunit A
MTAPTIASLEADVTLFNRTNLKALRNTNLGNMLNLCGLALPNGTDASGLPTSFLLSAIGGRDAQLLGYGLAAEAVLRED